MARKYKRITYKDREEIEKLCREGKNKKEIAEAVGVHVATIYRELEKGMSEGKYSADVAQKAI